MIRLLFIVLLLTGCGMSAERASTMQGIDLIIAHQRHIAIHDKANMVIVDRLVELGGLSEAARAEYAAGHRAHVNWPDTNWGRPTGYAFAYDKMGYTEAQVNEWLGGFSGGGTTIYTQRGSITIKSYGNGVGSISGGRKR